MTDEQLLGTYIDRRDDAAFEDIVRRHGPMVWRVCRRLVSAHQDAEDAFQATFLVLVRKARSIARRDLLGNWLYGVAYQTALKARAVAARRRMRERQVTAMPEPEARSEEVRVHDWQPLLDKALSGLPHKYRAAIVLCDLEGLTYKEAAGRLGWPQGTLSVLLMRARRMLARRLKSKDGLAPDVEAVTDVLAEAGAPAPMPASLVVATVGAANLFAAGQAAAAGALSANVAALTEGVLKAMLFTKLKVAAAIVLLATVCTGAGLLGYSAVTAQSDQEKIQGTWTFVSLHVDGNPVMPPGPNPACQFAGDKFRTNGIDGAWSFKLNAAKNPKEIDLTVGAALTKGIYVLKGDDLQLNLPFGGKERPRQFSSKPGDGNYLAVLKRK